MAWVSGVYSRGYPSWSNDAAANLPISASKFDTEDNDFAAGLNNCLTKDGLSGPNTALTWTQANAAPLNLRRGTDGAVFTLGRTLGTNNPVLTFSALDAQGVTLAVSTGYIQIISNAAANSSANDFGINRAGSTANTIAQGPNIQLSDTSTSNASLIQQSAGQTEFWQYNGAWNQILKFLTTRGVTINAPASGNGLTVSGGGINVGGSSLIAATSGTTFEVTNSGTSAVSLLVDATSSTGPLMEFSNSGTPFGYMGSSKAVIGGGLNDLAFFTGGSNQILLGTNSATRITINSAGAVSVAAPTAGYALTVSGLAGSLAAQFSAPNTASNSYGLRLQAGTNSSDYSFLCSNAAGTLNAFEVRGDGYVFITDTRSPIGTRLSLRL